MKHAYGKADLWVCVNPKCDGREDDTHGSTKSVYGEKKQLKLVCEMNGWLWLPTFNNRYQYS